MAPSGEYESWFQMTLGSSSRYCGASQSEGVKDVVSQENEFMCGKRESNWLWSFNVTFKANTRLYTGWHWDWPKNEDLLFVAIISSTGHYRKLATGRRKVTVSYLTQMRAMSFIWSEVAYWRQPTIGNERLKIRVAFLPRDATRRARLCHSKSSVCLSVCPSVRLSVRDVEVWFSHRLEYFENNFTAK